MGPMGSLRPGHLQVHVEDSGAGRMGLSPPVALGRTSGPSCVLRVWNPLLWPFGMSAGMRETAHLRTRSLPVGKQTGLPSSLDL